MTAAERIAHFLDSAGPAVLVRLAEVRGSAPREAGAWMLIAPGRTHGTIGGGQLEYIAIDEARRLLRDGKADARLDIPLGPEIGQCCGGRVVLSLRRLDAEGRAALIAETEAAALPMVLIFGAGHTGRALAEALRPLPVRAKLIDSRAEELARAPHGAESCLTPLPEAEVRGAPPGSAFVVLTHDHALDFLIAREALARGDAAYVGLIGSATKRARFARFCSEDGVNPAALTCPIGDFGSRDRRPEVIAAFTATELLVRLGQPRQNDEKPGRTRRTRESVHGR